MHLIEQNENTFLKDYVSLVEKSNEEKFPVNFRLFSKMPIAPNLHFTVPCKALQTNFMNVENQIYNKGGFKKSPD